MTLHPTDSTSQYKSPEYLRWLSRREQHRREAAHDPNAFMEYVFQMPGGGSHVQADMHKEWQAAVTRDRLAIIIAPRLHLKTTEIAIGRPLYELGQNVNQLIKIICQSDAKAVKRIESIRDIVANNSDLHGVFPHLHQNRLTLENKHQLQFERSVREKDPSIEGAGITSSASGDRAHIIVADDACDRRNSITLPKVRDSIIESWDDWFNLLPPDGRLWYICTPWHRADLTHKLIKNALYKVYWYKINLETLGSSATYPDGKTTTSDEPLWPQEQGGPWGKPQLSERREAIGPRAFARGFGTEAMEMGEQKVDPNWITYWREPPTSEWPILISVDRASTVKESSDWTGFVVGAIHPQIVSGEILLPTLRSTLKIIDAWHARLKFPDCVRLVRGLHKRYLSSNLEVDRVIIERAAGGIELGEELEETSTMRLFGVVPRGSKDDRLERITPYLSRGFVEFNPELNPERGVVNDERGDVVDELTVWPLSTKDIADALVHMVRFAMVTYPGYRDALVSEDGVVEALPPTARVMVF